jgi:hypothetical protein
MNRNGQYNINVIFVEFINWFILYFFDFTIKIGFEQFKIFKKKILADKAKINAFWLFILNISLNCFSNKPIELYV